MIRLIVSHYILVGLIAGAFLYLTLILSLAALDRAAHSHNPDSR
jgi:hypothetical protein